MAEKKTATTAKKAGVKKKPAARAETPAKAAKAAPKARAAKSTTGKPTLTEQEHAAAAAAKEEDVAMTALEITTPETPAPQSEAAAAVPVAECVPETAETLGETAPEMTLETPPEAVLEMDPGEKRPVNVLYVTSEAAPFCKTGGLADVAGSLPPALAAEGEKVAVILPLYQNVKEAYSHKMEFLRWGYVRLGWRSLYCGLFRLVRDGVTWYFVDNEQYFLRPELYGYYDDGERFAFFCRAVVELIPSLEEMPEVVHCNDWQTALVPIYLKDDGVRDERLRGIRTVLTVHNIEYQGRYGKETLGDLFGLDHGWWDDGSIVMDGDVNLLKAALLMADAVTAVSPTYAQELKDPFFAHGLESVLQRCEGKLHGVLNGIDMNRYDPAQDSAIAANYSAADLTGKAADKAHLQKVLGLRQEADTPIIGMVSRLVAHKGLDLVCDALPKIMELPVQLVVVGRGDRRYEEFFRWAHQQYPGRLAAYLNYDEIMAMNVYAGADLFLMPSKSEPCGLSQMIAMRYGTVPIVRETGGLKDTVHPYESWNDSGNGYTFANYNSADMLSVIAQAVGLYRDYADAFSRLRDRGMTEDFSWARSAGQYRAIYERILGRAH